MSARAWTTPAIQTVAVRLVPATRVGTAHDYALINSKHNHIGFDLPGQLAEGMEAADEEAAPRETEMPRAMEAYNPVVLSQFGTLKQKGDGGRTAVYEIQFANGWKAVNFVIWANASDGR